MKQNNQEMMLAVRVSLVCNAILFIIKAVTLVIVDSLAVAADLGISVIALGVSAFLYYAIKMSDKPADTFHNYGYGKIENVTEAVEGVILIGLAVAMSFQAFMHIIRVGEINSPLVGFIASISGVAINFWGAGYILKLGEKHASPALRAEGLHFRLEGLISLAITLSFALVILFNYLGLLTTAKYVDPVATLMVSVIITVPSVNLLRKAFMKLLDASIEETGQMDIVKVLVSHFDKYCDFNNIKTRSAGRKRFVDINLIMPDHLSVKNAHRIAATIKNDLKSSMAESEVIVHIEPCAKDCAFTKDNRKCPYAE